MEGEPEPEALRDTLGAVDEQRRRRRQAQRLDGLLEQCQPADEVAILELGDGEVLGHGPAAIAARAEQQRRPEIVHGAEVVRPLIGGDAGLEDRADDLVGPHLLVKGVDDAHDPGLVESGRGGPARHGGTHGRFHTGRRDRGHRLAHGGFVHLSDRRFGIELDEEAHRAERLDLVRLPRADDAEPPRIEQLLPAVLHEAQPEPSVDDADLAPDAVPGLVQATEPCRHRVLVEDRRPLVGAQVGGNAGLDHPAFLGSISYTTNR